MKYVFEKTNQTTFQVGDMLYKKGDHQLTPFEIIAIHNPSEIALMNYLDISRTAFLVSSLKHYRLHPHYPRTIGCNI